VRSTAVTGYVDELMTELEMHLIKNTKPHLDAVTIPTLASRGKQVDKAVLVEKKLSRGIRTKPQYLP